MYRPYPADPDALIAFNWTQGLPTYPPHVILPPMLIAYWVLSPPTVPVTWTEPSTPPLIYALPWIAVVETSSLD